MKFQSFVNFLKKIKEIIKMFLHFWFFTYCSHPFSFRASFFIERPMFHYIRTFIMFRHVEYGKHTWIHTSKIRKSMLILKFHPPMKCLHVFFSFFHPGMKFHPCLSSRNEILSRQKRVNGKRHFTINRDDFIRGCNFTCKHPLRNFTKFTGKHLCQSLLFNKVAESLLKKGL